MANFLTLKNSLKKLEVKQREKEKYPHCGVIRRSDYDKLDFSQISPENNSRKVGYLLVPDKVTLEQWEEEYSPSKSVKV